MYFALYVSTIFHVGYMYLFLNQACHSFGVNVYSYAGATSVGGSNSFLNLGGSVSCAFIFHHLILLKIGKTVYR